jgi:hypothetical protein
MMKTIFMRSRADHLKHKTYLSVAVARTEVAWGRRELVSGDVGLTVTSGRCTTQREEPESSLAGAWLR